MARKMTLTFELAVSDDATQEQLDALIGGLFAVIEDDEAEALDGLFGFKAPGVPGWDPALAV